MHVIQHMGKKSQDCKVLNYILQFMNDNLCRVLFLLNIKVIYGHDIYIKNVFITNK